MIYFTYIFSEHQSGVIFLFLFYLSKNSLQIAGTVSLHKLLFGSYEDVRLEPEDKNDFSSIRTTSEQNHSVWWNHSLDILADLSLQTKTSLLQLFNWTVLWEFIGGAAHFTLCQTAGEQLLYRDTHSYQKYWEATSRSELSQYEIIRESKTEKCWIYKYFVLVVLVLKCQPQQSPCTFHPWMCADLWTVLGPLGSQARNAG